MKILFTLLIFISSLYSSGFTHRNIVGEWQLEGYKPNKTIQFGTYIGKQRNESITLLFNRTGKVKVMETGDIYFYEIINGDLKIYSQKIYKYGNIKKLKNRYSLMRLGKKSGNCYIMKTIKNKMPGAYKTKNGVKICKTNNFPIPVARTHESYKF